MRNIIKNVVTPNGDAIVDDTNDAIRVNVVSSTGSGMTDAEFSAHLPLPVSDNGSSLTVDGSVTVSATDLDIRNLSSVTDSVTVTGTVAATLSEPISVDDNGGSLTVDGTVAATQSGTWNIGTVSTITNVVHVDDNASTISVDDGGGTLTVDGSVTTNATKSSTATLSNVASSATSVTLLSANSNRLGATVYNDSTQILYLKFGTTASTSSYTVKMVADAYYEIPFNYTGRIDGIWASANGSARITELTA